ncbi:MAG: hypothetical protein V3V97_18465 [Hyphomicrobiaceae bacterium]
MGGVGSGRHRSFRASTCEDYNSLDLAALRRKGLFAHNGWSTLTFSRAGETIASIQVTSDDHGLCFRYRARSWDSNAWEAIEDRVPFTYTDTNFGGRRQWFQCPSCRRSCRVLYGGKYYRCRKCYGLKYESQYETSWMRAETQAQRICTRLGGTGCIDDPFPAKPKGMHWTTYDRLARRHEALTGRFVNMFGAWVEDLSAKIEHRRAQPQSAEC